MAPHGPPSNEVPGSVAFDPVIASTDGYVVFCSGLQVYSTGIRMNLELRARENRRHERLFDAFHGEGPDQMLLGVEFADGRRGTNLGWRRGRGDATGGGVTVACGGGGGSENAVDAEFFIAPLPPPGAVRLVCAWPSKGIADTVTELPAVEIAEAAERVRRLWPPRQHDDEPEPEPDPPQLPAGSWFAS